MGWWWTLPLQRLLLGFNTAPINQAFITSNKLLVTFKPFLKIFADLHAMLFLLTTEKSMGICLIFSSWENPLTYPTWQPHNTAYVLNGLPTIFQDNIPKTSDFFRHYEVDYMFINQCSTIFRISKPVVSLTVALNIFPKHSTSAWFSPSLK